MRRVGLALALWLLAPGGETRAAAQTGSQMMAMGITAYEEVELTTAATWLRRALAGPLTPAERARALSYLGATEMIRGGVRRDTALAVFRRLLLLDPRHRIDPLVFPPTVLRQFEEARRTTKAVVVVPGDGTDSLIGTVYATSPHELEARLVREDGVVVRTLYMGPIGDSLALRWDGRDTVGAYLPSGRYRLSVASRPTLAAPIARIVLVPLETDVVVPEPLPPPPPLTAVDLMPERTGAGPGVRALTLGLVAGGMILALPGVIADGAQGGGSDARFAVAGAVGVAGVVGFFTQRGRPLPANVALNTARRAEWERRRADVAAENERRRAGVRVVVRAGPGEPTVIDREDGRAP